MRVLDPEATKNSLVYAGKMILVQAGKIILTFLDEVTEAKSG